MSVTVIRPPAFEPISLEQARQHLRVDVYPGSPGGHPDDDLITRAIVAARERAEEITRRALVEQGLRLVAAGWYRDSWQRTYRHGSIDLLRPPLISVDQVSYYDDANVLRVVDPSHYFMEETQPVQRVRWAGAFDYPCVYARDDAVRVDYTAGYAGYASPVIDQEQAASGIPASIINGMLLLVGDMYENREATLVGLSAIVLAAADALFESKRVHNF
jgi:uncharacterized phiE125 gp8 family phage protein